MPISPAESAYLELDLLLGEATQWHPGPIQTVQKLMELWRIDDEAYQDCSLPFEVFQSWWQRYPLGNQTLTCLQNGFITASIGLWPLEERQYLQLATGRIPERKLTPVPLSQCERETQRFWYFSGVVLHPEYRGLVKNNPLACLLKYALKQILDRPYLGFPLTLGALAEYPNGENLLKRFGFQKILDLGDSPDRCSFYQLQLFSRQQAWQLLIDRRLLTKRVEFSPRWQLRYVVTSPIGDHEVTERFEAESLEQALEHGTLIQDHWSHERLAVTLIEVLSPDRKPVWKLK